MYIMYMTWSAMSNSPDKECKPNLTAVLTGGSNVTSLTTTTPAPGPDPKPENQPHVSAFSVSPLKTFSHLINTVGDPISD